MTPEVRLSPDGTRVALRFPGEKYWTAYEGRGFSEKCLTDEDVAAWTPLASARQPKRVTCQWCERHDRALNEHGQIRWHYGNGPNYWATRCPGTGRLPSEYAATTGDAP